ncbi:MAG: hypothetical protein U9N82_07150, partial [Thermodesulfobacteriota bacterium]|nr:hypothetical protein [Thermodesulfobacteriota bacterium]
RSNHFQRGMILISPCDSSSSVITVRRSTLSSSLFWLLPPVCHLAWKEQDPHCHVDPVTRLKM